MEKDTKNIQPADKRVRNVREVALGFGKKISQDYARRCPQCAQPVCNHGCPLGIDIPSFIRLLREGDAQGACAVIQEQNPFPSICGRVCLAPCETACIFHADGNPIEIRDLERFAADHGASKYIKKESIIRNGFKVAVIGSGPAGLMMSMQLAKVGYEVIVYDCASEPGGILRYGIPEFRLPQHILDEVIVQIKHIGVEFMMDVFFGRTLTLQELLMRGFHAVVLTNGSAQPVFLDIPGVGLGGVYVHLEFLNRMQSMSKSLSMESGQKLFKSKVTAVMGKNIFAFDSARLARRMGQDVTMFWLGQEDVLIQHKDIVRQCEEEGIALKEGIQLRSINSDEFGHVSSVTVQDIIENASIEFDVQTVILDHDCQPNQFIRQHLPQLRFNDNGTIWIDPQNAMTSVEKVFACGDMVIHSQSIVHAMAHAKEVAKFIHTFLVKK